LPLAPDQALTNMVTRNESARFYHQQKRQYHGFQHHQTRSSNTQLAYLPPRTLAPVSQHFITLMARGSPSLHEAADMLSAIRALEDELAQLRRHAQEIKIAAVQAFEKDINHIMTAYKDTLDLLGDEHARRWVSERAPEELRTLDEVMRCVESMEGGFAEAE
jgi:hypothetical protein